MLRRLDGFGKDVPKLTQIKNLFTGPITDVLGFGGLGNKPMSQGIRTEIKHLYKRFRSLAVVRRRGNAAPATCAAGDVAFTNVSKSPSRDVPARTSACPLRRASSAVGLIGKIFASMPASSSSAQLPQDGGCVLLRFNEIILDKGARLKARSDKSLYAGRRIEKFCKAGLDGPRPILNLARDDLDHQHHFLNCCL